MSPFLAHLRHADRSLRCPLSGANRKTFARSEPYRFCPTRDIAAEAEPRFATLLDGKTPRLRRAIVPFIGTLAREG
jgi:hypothetical protein